MKTTPSPVGLSSCSSRAWAEIQASHIFAAASISAGAADSIRTRMGGLGTRSCRYIKAKNRGGLYEMSFGISAFATALAHLWSASAVSNICRLWISNHPPTMRKPTLTGADQSANQCGCGHPAPNPFVDNVAVQRSLAAVDQKASTQPRLSKRTWGSYAMWSAAILEQAADRT